MGLFWNRNASPTADSVVNREERDYQFTTKRGTEERVQEVRERYLPYLLAQLEAAGVDVTSQKTLLAVASSVGWASKGRVKTPGLLGDEPKAVVPVADTGFRSMWDLNHDLAQREMNVAGRASWPSGRVMTDRELAEYGVRR